MATSEYLQLPNPAVEAAAFAAGIEAVDDDPEETVRLLCDAFERQLGKHWLNSAARAYRGRCQTGIIWQVMNAVGETRKRLAPTWIGAIAKVGGIEFVQTAICIRQSGSDADWLLAERLELAARHGRQYFTPGWITGWLYLAKGIRNREVHAGSWPLELRCVAAFVARLLLHVFVSTFPPPEE
jgi:hypothetical protein